MCVVNLPIADIELRNVSVPLDEFSAYALTDPGASSLTE